MSWKCKKCNWENADKWVNCAKCNEPSSLPPKIESKEDKVFKYVVITLLATFFIIIIVLLSTVNEMFPQPIETKELVSDFDAYYICTKFIEDRLKSPSTAKFQPGYYATITKLSPVLDKVD